MSAAFAPPLDAVVDPVDPLAVAGHQRLAQRLGLGAAIVADHAAGRDRRVHGLQAAAVEQGQRLAADGADEQVEQFAVHTVKLWRKAGRIPFCRKGQP